MPEVVVYEQATAEQFARIEDELRPLTDAADEPPNRRGQPTSFRRKTLVLLLVMCGLLPLAPLHPAAPVLVGVAVFILFTMFLIQLVQDSIAPSPRGRTSAAAAVRCYYTAVRNHHWRAAFACLSPMARERPVRVPAIAHLKTEPAEHVRSTPKALRAYWRTIACRSLRMFRRLAKLEVVATGDEGNVRRVRVSLHVQYGMFGVDRYRQDFEAIAYRHRSQWWIYSGEFRSAAAATEPQATTIGTTV